MGKGDENESVMVNSIGEPVGLEFGRERKVFKSLQILENLPLLTVQENFIKNHLIIFQYFIA